MNIFPLDQSPLLAAQSLYDAHVRKMGIESAQILSTVLRRASQLAPYEKVNPENHPAILWSEQSKENFEWVLQHGIEICLEFERRFGHSHKALLALKEIENSTYRPTQKILCSFGQFVPEKYQQINSIEAYRNVYAEEKIAFANYSQPSEPPIWLWEKLIHCYPANIAEIKNGKILIFSDFLIDLSSFLEKQLSENRKEVSLKDLFLKFGFGDYLDFPLPQRKPGILLSISEKRFYRFQFLISYLCEQEMLPKWKLVTGKNVRVVRKKKK
jgi:hypothetical protein